MLIPWQIGAIDPRPWAKPPVASCSSALGALLRGSSPIGQQGVPKAPDGEGDWRE